VEVDMSWEFFIPTALPAMLVVGFVLIASATRSSAARPWMLLAALSIAVMPVAIVLHNVVSALIGAEETVFFVAALAAGMCLFGLYALVAVVVTTVAGENLPWQRTVEPLVLPASSLLLASGALWGLVSIVSQRGATASRAD
jgi:hypothetical protein